MAVDGGREGRRHSRRNYDLSRNGHFYRENVSLLARPLNSSLGRGVQRTSLPLVKRRRGLSSVDKGHCNFLPRR